MILVIMIVTLASVVFGDSECYLDNVLQSGGDLKQFKDTTMTKEYCLEACQRFPNCETFMLRLSDKRCYLKTTKAIQKNNRDGYISGKMECFRGETEEPAESGFVNVAQMEKAVSTQSGVKSNGIAARATDGNTVTWWDAGGCAFTNNGFLNYWQVTLDKSYKIDHVVIYGSSTSWSNDEGVLDGAKLLIGDQICEVISGMKEQVTTGHVFSCTGHANKLTGKVVRLENFKKMAICEVQIMVKKDDLADEPPTLDPAGSVGQDAGEFYNVAFRKATTSSSVSSDAGPDRVVDGWTSQVWNAASGSCAQTSNQGKPEYWKVDLGRAYKIDHILVYNRNGDTRKEIKNAIMWIEDNLCARLQDTGKDGGWMEKVKCDEDIMAGRHISISNHRATLGLCEVQVMVKKTDMDVVPEIISWPGERLGELTNVALSGRIFRGDNWNKATQSSVHNGKYAGMAVDGHRDGNYNAYSVTHTLCDGPQWWQVDLGRVYKIHHVTVYGRTDGSASRINGARVWAGQTQVGDPLKLPSNANDPMTVQPEGDLYASSVMVDLLDDCLSLAEVEVWVANVDVTGDEPLKTVPTWENVAVRRPTKQSSTFQGKYHSNRVVDNFPDYLNMGDDSCSHTNKEGVNSWEVDLEKEYYIDHVVVYGRNDGSLERLDKATLEIDNRIVAGFTYYEDQTKWTFPLYGYKGQVVKITRKNEYLSLCEVQVMVNNDYVPEDVVEPINQSKVNLASTAEASSSGNLFGAAASLVKDGNIDGDFFQGSCFYSRPAQSYTWLKMDLGGVKTISHVYVYPRLDYFRKMNIDGAVVKVGEVECGRIVYESGVLYYSLDCQGARGAEITIQKLGFLSICEIVIHEG